MVHLPKHLRPNNIPHREFRPGIDLPAWFHDEIKGIDENLYFVWHPWKVLYDDVMNQYTGSIDEPRFSIQEYSGQEIWGFPLTDPKGDPLPDNTWHIWRLSQPYGWCHVFCVNYDNPLHLRKILKNLYINGKLNAEGKKKYREYLEQKEEEDRSKKQAESDQLFNDVQDENKWLVRKAAENYERGHYAPTNPIKETIINYPGQKNRTKTVRGLDDTDKESGIVLPDSWKE